MQRTTVLIFAIAAYALSLVSLLYAIGFVGNFIVPKSIDATPTMAFWPALLINLTLLGVFAVSHSVMARPAVKRIITRVIPEAAERSLFILVASSLLITLFYFWQPLGGEIWRLDHPVAVAVLYAVQLTGWGIVFLSSFLINHFELFGLQQAWKNFKNQPASAPKFVTPLLYRLVRHPLYLGLIIAFWATPQMTVTHLVFAIMTTAYIFIGARLEEHDLETELGDDYREYKSRVPMIVPVRGPVRTAAGIGIKTPVTKVT